MHGRGEQEALQGCPPLCSPAGPWTPLFRAKHDLTRHADARLRHLVRNKTRFFPLKHIANV